MATPSPVRAPDTARAARGVGALARGLAIPYEHAAVFDIQGRPGRIAQDVITIGPDGLFVAVALGYGFDEDRGAPLALDLPGNPPVEPRRVTLQAIPLSALIEGVRIDPAASPVVHDPAVPPAPPVLTGRRVPRAWVRERLLQRVGRRQDVSFLFSMIDSASGRELQDAPAHNLASLGSGAGERPFRPLAWPLAFQPRSTVRLQVVEHGEGIRGRLDIVLFGYKLPGTATCPEPLLRAIGSSVAPRAPHARRPGRRLVPFDYVLTFPLEGRAGNRLSDEIVVNVEGGFVGETLGYGLAPATRNVPLLAAARQLGVAANPVPLANLPLQAFPPGALVDGIRLRPEMVRLAANPGGGLAAVPEGILDGLFESLNPPEDVAFRYSIFDGGTGRELQNRPVFSLAGLGAANGERPFKRFARPLVFAPRSTLRVEVEERWGRGTLFLVLQGYRVTGAPAGRP